MRADGAAGYYLNAVAKGVEDYYVGRGEAPGRWLGKHAGELGLADTVEPDDLVQVLDGHDPVSRTRLTRSRHRRVPGFDLTFCAPKSVSVVWSLGDADTRRAAREAHDAAVDAAIAYLERHACWSRRGTDGFHQVRGAGFIAAAFRHRTSRTGDPHLHTHVLVVNATRSDDGWGTLDARHLYLHAKTAGYLYQAQLRAEVTRRLGIAWTSVHHGCADIAGIPPAVLRRFATRSDEIKQEMNRLGTTSARAAQYAVLATRQAKDYDVDAATLHSTWMDQAAEIGFRAEDLEAMLRTANSLEASPRTTDAIRQSLLGPEGLTKQASTFDRRDVLRACCEHFAEGADVTVIEQLADAILADPEVVPLRPADYGSSRPMRRRTTGRVIKTPLAGARYSTQSLLTLEARLISRATVDAATPLGVVTQDTVLAALAARPGLAQEQVHMVATLTTSGRPLDVVVAPAGAGKTFALDAARDAWQRSGHRVIGAAVSARAAAELEATAGIASDTIAKLLLDLDDPRLGPLQKNTVIVIDEAGMVGTRLLARVLDHAHAGETKVVLVGDPRQLPEIDAGGLLRGLAHRWEPIRLIQNRRQREAWERAALADLRDGRIDQAVETYDSHGRVRTCETAPAARDAMAADWRACALAGERVLMLANRWSDVDDLNARARHRCQTDGTLTGPVLIINERPYQAGDRVMTLRNNRRIGARNGTCATVQHIDTDTRSMALHTDTGALLVLPAEYLDAGHVRHAYATTIHKAQGQTVDRALVLGSDTLYQEAGYVALSRGRIENRIYLVQGQPRPEAHGHEMPPPEPLDTLQRTLATSHAQHLAVESGIDGDAIRRALDDLIDQRSRLRNIASACPPSREYELDALTRRRLKVAEQHAAATSTLETLATTRRWHHSRDRAAQRVVLIRQTHDTATRVSQFDEAIERLRHQHREHTAFVSEHEDELRLIPTIEHAIEARLEQLVEADVNEPPAYLRGLGAVPINTEGLDRWRHAAQYVERHRTERGITDQHRPFGPKPDGDRAVVWHAETRQLDDLIAKIDLPTPHLERGIELA